jgi:hypothetical protein
MAEKKCGYSWDSGSVFGKVVHIIVTNDGEENLLAAGQHRCQKVATVTHEWSVGDRKLSQHTCGAHAPKKL